MSRVWEADPTAHFAKRMGRSALQLGATNNDPSCPDLWELSNGDVAVIGRDLTDHYTAQLPDGVHVGEDERLVVIPGVMIRSAKSDIPDEHCRKTVLTGTVLTAEEYLADFTRCFWEDNGGVSWKLERRQEFVESANESWEASLRGDWHESLTLLERGRVEVADYERRIAQHGMEVRRVRVVESPISRYLLWELSSLHVRHEVGGKIRVVGRQEIAEHERGTDVLPELFLLSRGIAYQVLYDQNGELEGAVKCTDPEQVERWSALITGLYERGEELGAFFEREVVWRLPTAD